MKSKSSQGEERADDPEDEMRGEDEDEKVVYQWDGGESAGNEGSHVVIGTEESHDQGKDYNEENERREGHSTMGEQKQPGEKEDGGAKEENRESFLRVADGILGCFGSGGEGDSEDVSAEAKGKEAEEGEFLDVDGYELFP